MRLWLFETMIVLAMTTSVFSYQPPKSEGQIRAEERSRAIIERQKATIAWAEGGKKTASNSKPSPQKSMAPQVISATAKLVEDHDYSSQVKISWRVTVSNSMDAVWKCMVKVEFIDSEGFVLETDTKFDVLLDPRTETIVSDPEYMERKVWTRVSNVKGTIEYY